VAHGHHGRPFPPSKKADPPEGRAALGRTLLISCGPRRLPYARCRDARDARGPWAGCYVRARVVLDVACQFTKPARGRREPCSNRATLTLTSIRSARRLASTSVTGRTVCWPRACSPLGVPAVRQACCQERTTGPGPDTLMERVALNPHTRLCAGAAWE